MNVKLLTKVTTDSIVSEMLSAAEAAKRPESIVTPEHFRTGLDAELAKLETFELDWTLVYINRDWMADLNDVLPVLHSMNPCEIDTKPDQFYKAVNDNFPAILILPCSRDSLTLVIMENGAEMLTHPILSKNFAPPKTFTLVDTAEEALTKIGEMAEDETGYKSTLKKMLDNLKNGYESELIVVIGKYGISHVYGSSIFAVAGDMELIELIDGDWDELKVRALMVAYTGDCFRIWTIDNGDQFRKEPLLQAEIEQYQRTMNCADPENPDIVTAPLRPDYFREMMNRYGTDRIMYAEAVLLKGEDKFPLMRIRMLDGEGDRCVYLSPFRGYCFQVSGDAEGHGDLGSSPVVGLHNIITAAYPNGHNSPCRQSNVTSAEMHIPVLTGMAYEAVMGASGYFSMVPVISRDLMKRFIDESVAFVQRMTSK